MIYNCLIEFDIFVKLSQKQEGLHGIMNEKKKKKYANIFNMLPKYITLGQYRY